MVRNIFSVLVSMTMFGALCARAEHIGGDPNRSQAQPQIGVMVNGICVPGFPGNVPVQNPPVSRPATKPPVSNDVPERDDAKKPAVKPKAADSKKDEKNETTGQAKKDDENGPVAAKGAQLIEKNCASCHNGPTQPKIADLDFSMVEKAMKGELEGEGIAPMPKGSASLSESEQKEIVNHLKSLEEAKK